MTDEVQGQAQAKKETYVPDEVKGLSWGAFTCGWIWGLFNRTWIALLCMLPVVGFVMSCVLLFKGNEWAWKNKQWDTVENFHSAQRKWAVVGLIFWAFVIVSFFAMPHMIQVRNARLGQ